MLLADVIGETDNTSLLQRSWKCPDSMRTKFKAENNEKWVNSVRKRRKKAKCFGSEALPWTLCVCFRVCLRVCVCCRHSATSQLVNYANCSLGPRIGAGMKYCLHTRSHDWLHMLGENSQKIRPVEGKMSERSTLSERKGQVFLWATEVLAAEAESGHMEPFHMNQHTWKGRWRGRSWRCCCRLYQHCLCFHLGLFLARCQYQIAEAHLEVFKQGKNCFCLTPVRWHRDTETQMLQPRQRIPDNECFGDNVWSQGHQRLVVNYICKLPSDVSMTADKREGSWAILASATRGQNVGRAL